MATQPFFDRAWELAKRPRRVELWHAGGGLCHWCRKPTLLTNEVVWEQATCDHVIPRSKGGSSDDSNIVLACRRCNGRRSYEDQCGLPEGSMMGKFKETLPPTRPKVHDGVYLSKDEKAVLMGGKPGKVSNEERFRADRDRLLAEVMKLREQKKHLEEALNDQTGEIERLRETLQEMTVWMLVKRRLIQWLS